MEACRLRLRPILMTSFAFIIGVVPLVVATGAGAEMRRSLGIAVFSGMLGVTLFGIFLTPVFFYVIQGLSETRLFSAQATRWVGSTLVGGLAGWGIGYLLAPAGSRPTAPGGPSTVGRGRHDGRCWPCWTSISRSPARGRPMLSEHRDSPASAELQPGLPVFHGDDPIDDGRESMAVISHFFIDRPVFAIVLSLVIVLAGGVAVFTLPVAQYPDVTPPTVLVTAIYPGANAQTVRNTVAAPIEEQVSGVENMLYMSSQCTNDGTYNLTVTFRLGMDTDMAQVLVQNRVSLALPVIPALVQNEGISVKKMSPSTMMIVNLLSPDGRYDNTFLSNYATIYIKDELGRLPGVAGHHLPGPARLQPPCLARSGQDGGAQPERHRRRQRHQPAEPPGRRRADRPAARPQGPAIPAHHQHPGPAGRARAVRRHHPQGRRRLMPRRRHSSGGVGGGAAQGPEPAGAAELPGRTRPTRAARTARAARMSQATGIVRLRDVARVELGSRQYDQSCTLDGKPSVAISIYQLPGSNALETAKGVYAKMRELKARFPDGLDYQIVYDTTPFIHESINEVFNTLRDAIILVGIVVLVFLQDWKAMILPMIDVPVTLDRHLRHHGRCWASA